jgi:hypothetical protein
MACVVPIRQSAEALHEVRVAIAPDLEAERIRERIPSLMAVARRLLDEHEARAVVDEAIAAACELMVEFRASNPGVWLQGIVVGLSVARAGQERGVGT